MSGVTLDEEEEVFPLRSKMANDCVEKKAAKKGANVSSSHWNRERMLQGNSRTSHRS